MKQPENWPPGNTIELHIRIAKEDWSNYIQSNDYSFTGNNSDYQNWNQAAVYYNGELIFGTEPVVKTLGTRKSGRLHR